MLEDEDCIYDLLLDDLDLETLMEVVDSSAGVEEEDSAHETQGNVVTWEKPGTPGVVQDGDRSHHDRSASAITLGVNCDIVQCSYTAGICTLLQVWHCFHTP